MKTKNSLWLALGFIGLTATTMKAQVGINNTAANPDPSAILDLQSGNAGVNKGFLPQSVALTNVTVAAPVVSPATGLIVYSTSAPAGGFGVGYYYWNGSTWVTLGAPAATLSNLTQGTGITAFTYNGSAPATVGIANTTVTAGNYGSATAVPTYTVNAQGQLTGAANLAISAVGIGAVTGTGINNYVARWTPSSTNIGTGMIQDNGTTVGVNFAPIAGAMLYSVTGTGDALAGYSTDGTSYGVAGFNSATGIGTYGAGSTYSIYGDATFYGAGSGGYFTDGTNYVTAADNTNGNGITAYGAMNGGFFSDANGDYSYLANNGSGFGIYAYGGSLGNVGGYFTSAAGAQCYIGDGVINAGGNFFDNTLANEGIIADGTNGAGVWGSGASFGVFGTNAAGGFNAGVFGQNTYASSGVGMGIYGEGSGAGGYYYPGIGTGVLGDATGFGVMGLADSTSGVGAGGYFASIFSSAYAYVGYFDGTTAWKISGGGSVGTVVKDNNNVSKAMACPEAPEILFEDYGTGALTNGKSHINLDPTYAKNVTINQKHPLRVLITLNDADCNGVAVVNRTTTGFDVVELAHGTSNATFTYEVIANRADEYDASGKLVSKNADIRFTKGAEPFKTAKAAAAKNMKGAQQTASVPMHKLPVVNKPIHNTGNVGKTSGSK